MCAKDQCEYCTIITSVQFSISQKEFCQFLIRHLLIHFLIHEIIHSFIHIAIFKKIVFLKTKGTLVYHMVVYVHIVLIL